MKSWLVQHWEQTLFSATGFAFLSYSLWFLSQEKVTETSVCFGIGFLSFLYANVSRFKRFKGLGFEAELWEDKQKEAADLVEKLKGIVEIYTYEALMSRLMLGRFGGSGKKWKSHWDLFNRLKAEHSELGQDIDLTRLKSDMDDVFFFDMTLPLVEGIRKPIWDGRQRAQEVINDEFGSPISDIEGHSSRTAQIREVRHEIDYGLDAVKRMNTADELLKWAKESKLLLDKYFSVDIEFDPSILEQLKFLSRVYEQRPITITDQLIAMADDAAK